MHPLIPVASYCRVSTDRADQLNSFESQQRYFREYIARHPQWDLYEVYADEGITGTSTKKRAQFNRMISDAYAGKFKLILTKEVSRFSRNLLDTIAYTRELKALGIGVVFMNDGFSSLDPDAELRLSIMGSIAQEESRKTSARVKWGQTRQMERGVVFGTSMLGYRVREGKLTIEPDGAEIVRLIFHKYGVEKKGISVIARELREAGLRTYRDQPDWNSGQILKILKNEKYVGDLVQKKTITPDYLTHAKKANRGEEALISIDGHHAPIIDRTLWDAVQGELKRRSRPATRHSTRYVFSGKILCGECGGKFVSRRKTRKSGGSYLRWCCHSSCGIGKILRDELAMEALIQAIMSIPMDRAFLITRLTAIANAAISAPVTNSQTRLHALRKKKEAAIDAYLSGTITQEELAQMKARYDQKIALTQAQLPASRPESPDLKEKIAAIVMGTAPAEPLYRALLDCATMEKDGTFHLRLRHLPQTWHFQLRYHKTSP